MRKGFDQLRLATSRCGACKHIDRLYCLRDNARLMFSRLPFKRLLLMFAVALSTLATGAVHADAPANDLKPVLDQVRQIERDLKYGRYNVSELRRISCS